MEVTVEIGVHKYLAASYNPAAYFIQETVSTWLPALKVNDDFWSMIQKSMKAEVCLPRAVRTPSIPSKVSSSSTSTSSSPAAHIMMDERDFEGEPETNNHQEDHEEDSEQMES